MPKEMTGHSFVKLRGEPYEGRKYVFAERGAHGSGGPTNSAAFDLGRCVVGKYKLIYNALWQIPYWPVDFAGDKHWQEMVERNASGKLPPELAKVRTSPPAQCSRCSMWNMTTVSLTISTANPKSGPLSNKSFWRPCSDG